MTVGVVFSYAGHCPGTTPGHGQLMPLHLDILDVGQSDGMVIWRPDDKIMMVDLGSTKNKELVTADSGTQIAVRYVRRL